MTYAMPFQKYVKTVLRVAMPSSARCFTTMCVVQRVDLGRPLQFYFNMHFKTAPIHAILSRAVNDSSEGE